MCSNRHLSGVREGFLGNLINREASSGQTEPKSRAGEEVKKMAKSMTRNIR